MYQSLVIYGYQHTTDLTQEYERRFGSFSSFHTELEIIPFSQQKEVKLLDHTYQLFGLAIPEHVTLIENIMKQSQMIKERIAHLPTVAHYFLERKLLINEIKSTNDIEGVRSSKKEIRDAIDAIDTVQKMRFKHIVKSYAEIKNNKPHIKRLEDLRGIYDKVVAEEIDDKNKLDGNLFRRESVDLFDEQKGKVVHRGTVDEERIQTELLNLIYFMNDDVSFMYKAIVSHYYFEYIHPFYDGNGRVGRFILSSYLAYKLDHFTALSLSGAIYANKDRYEKAFIEMSNKNNFGDVTLFIYEMLVIIEAGQTQTLEEINLARLKMDHMAKYIELLDLEDDQKTILYIICQHYTFALPDELLENQYLKNILGTGFSRRKVDRVMESLDELGYIKRVKKRPIAYRALGDKLEVLD